MKEKKIKNIQSIYIPEDKIPILEALDVIRWREHKSMSDMILEAMKEYAERHKEGNDQMRLDSPDMRAIPQFLAKMEKKRKCLQTYPVKELDDIKFAIQEWNGAYKEVTGISAV